MNKDAALELVFGPLDPAAEFRYFVEVDGLSLATFIEASGFTAERDVLQVREGGVNDYVHKLPGRVTYSELILRRGISFSTQLWEWFEEGIFDGKVKRRDLTVIQYSSYFNLPARWYDFTNAFPSKWEGPPLRTDSSQLAIESLTLTFDYLVVRDWSSIDFAATLSKLIPV